MTKLPVTFGVLFAALALTAQSPARAQSTSPQQIQSQIANGQDQAALNELHGALQAHPNSAVAWYLSAEAQDGLGNESAASSALAKAQQLAPGLPFARPSDVAALQSHLADTPSAAGYAQPRHSGVSPVMIGIIALAVLFFVLRMFRRRRFVGQPGYPPANYAQGGMGPGPYPYGQNPGGMGSGIGGSILGGLAAGAGFAAGERVIGDMFGGNNAQAGTFQQDQNFGNGAPDRDDGLQGNPGWDDGSNNQDDNFDNGGNSW